MEPFAPYACKPEESRGRRYPEEESRMRTVFQRDRDRIIHASAFRRLKYKTQVFVYHEGDHYRTRLTHSLEVAQIARAITRTLRLNEDLAEGLALAHDIGHPPFGHAGEAGLNEAMAAYGGFDHNAHTLRILTSLERRYAEFDGLNLTWETLEGVVKHNGPLTGPKATAGQTVPGEIADYIRVHDLEIETFPGLEAQIASLSDDIAYHSHDLDDGLRAGLFTVDEVADVPLVGPVVADVRARYPKIEVQRLVPETIRRLIDRMVQDLVAETKRRLQSARPENAQAIRELDAPVVAFSGTMEKDNQALKAFLMRRMYRHYKVNRMASKARRIVKELFGLFICEPGCLPTEWQVNIETLDKSAKAQLVLDYIAGMTDRFALEEHRRLFDSYAKIE
ncbi:MAG: deoxyguanosinetriphosphate triphosphohydrolase [Rhodospirillaceae bacterium]|nr:MAG: deoxyguanosinetriphosphate triphosphohydrolase [Rhodospirillaceae bacterium]